VISTYFTHTSKASIRAATFTAFLMLATSHASAGETTLEWDASANPDTSGYVINYGTSSGDYTAKVDVGNVTTYKLKDLDDGKMYYFAVTAYDPSHTQSNYSNEVSHHIASNNSGGASSPGTVPSGGDGSSGSGATSSSSNISTGGGGGGCTVSSGTSDFSLIVMAGLALLGLRRRKRKH